MNTKSYFLGLIIAIITTQLYAQDVLRIPETTPEEKICFTLYTVHENTLKLSAFFYPLDDWEDFEATLEIKENGEWITADRTKILYPGMMAAFRVEDWDDTKMYNYRVNHMNTAFYEGIVQKNPDDKEEITVFAFTGNSTWRLTEEGYVDDDRSDIVENIKRVQPDLLFFSGDQVYNHSRHYNAWLKFGRDYGEVVSNIPTVTIPDDHDIGQGNLWGENGKVSKSRNGSDGGYYMPVEYVKEVERAQTSHLPDPYDATPIMRDIGVYYTDLTWGGIGFAIIEDRKFKTGPEGRIPQQGPRPDHYTTADYDPEALDIPGVQLLGERQLRFLEDWTTDWKDTEMKTVLSQTIFAGGAHIHGKINGRLYADLDANGWPQTGRNKALDVIRKSYSFMLAGDQHLATVLHHGIDEWGDAGYSFCVPSIRNYYLRWWDPLEPGKNRDNGEPEIYGDFLDGFNNKVTMHAVANPTRKNETHNRSEGFGVVKYNKRDRTITMECWPRNMDITSSDASQYEGWPITIKQTDNYSRRPVAYLPELKINKPDQVVQVIHSGTEEVIYALRIKGNSFTPAVFAPGSYIIKVGEGSEMVVKNNIAASEKPLKQTLEIDL